MKIRKFDKYYPTDKDKNFYLFMMLFLAIRDFQDSTMKRRTDLIGLACQFGGAMKIVRKDFDLIKDLTINDIIKIYEK